MTIVDNQVSGSSLSTYTYTHDELGRRDDRTQSGSAINTTSTDDFEYNPRSEVIASTNSDTTNKAAAKWNPTYTFDQIGNRSGNTVDINGTTSYVADELNQYDSVGGVMWDDPDNNKGYDLDGNFLGDGNWVYTWNNENRLSSATNGTITIDFTYDYQGRLVRKDDGTYVEVYVYDGWNRIATFRPQVSTLIPHKTYLWGMDLSGSMQGAGGVGGLLKETKNEAQGTTNYYPLYDANGNIMQKLDGTGAVVMNVEYDPFGNIISGTLEGEYGFSTKPLVDNLDWYYYGFRYYDPVTGRWPSRDPIGEQGGLNLYSMVGNDPVNSWDYMGLKRTFYDSTGSEVGQDRKWWPFTAAKFIEGPNGNVKYCGKKYWEVWEHDADSLPGTFSGVFENWKSPMKSFVDTNKRGWSFTFLTYGYRYWKSLPTVIENSPTGEAWDYKATLDARSWYIYDKKAYRHDSIGNITWGAIMKSYKWPEGLAKKGAGAYQTYEDVTNDRFDVWKFISNLWNLGDDPRDSAAIGLGYEF